MVLQTDEGATWPVRNQTLDDSRQSIGAERRGSTLGENLRRFGPASDDERREQSQGNLHTASPTSLRGAFGFLEKTPTPQALLRGEDPRHHGHYGTANGSRFRTACAHFLPTNHTGNIRSYRHLKGKVGTHGKTLIEWSYYDSMDLKRLQVSERAQLNIAYFPRTEKPQWDRNTRLRISCRSSRHH